MHLQVTRKVGAEEGNRSPARPPIKLGGESLARVQTAIPTELVGGTTFGASLGFACSPASY